MINYFNFKKITQNTVLITNDFGKYNFLSKEEFINFLSNKIDKVSDVYLQLKNNRFILDSNDILSDNVINEYRNMKNYLFTGSSLHIFVVTNVCNYSCVYCQAQDDNTTVKGIMSIEVGRKAVDIALKSPASMLTFEFQGGEPLINYDVIKDMIIYAESNRNGKKIQYTIVSNLSLLSDEMIEFFIKYNVSICTSLDGSMEIQNYNIIYSSPIDSWTISNNAINRLRKFGIIPGAIQTTTRYSLNKYRDIVDTYVKLGFSSIFVRPLTPLGYAKHKWNDIGYSAEEYIEFYKCILEYILKINYEGINFREEYTVLFLRKILLGVADNYMELRSPCGAVLGQVAYYYNGDIYTCDEARMLAEAGCEEFKIGNVYSSEYNDLVKSKACEVVCKSSITESLSGCCDCVYQPYCGVCPVVRYASNKNIVSKDINTYRCKIYQGILDWIFEVLRSEDKEKINILKSWVMNYESKQ